MSLPASTSIPQSGTGPADHPRATSTQPQPEVAPLETSTWAQRLKPEAVLVAGGLLLTLFGQVLVQEVPAQTSRNSFLLLGIGLGLLFAGALHAEARLLPAVRWNALTRLLNWLRITSAQAICLLLAPAFAFVASEAAGVLGKMVNPVVAMLAWAFSILLVVIGGWSGHLPSWKPTWKIMGPALALFAGAVLIRGIQTATIPIVLSGDEGSAGWNAFEWVQGKVNNPFIVGWYSFPSFYFMLLSFSVRFLGTTAEAIRLTSAFAGALTVVALYFVARPWLGQRAALMASAFL
ncbi:MAG TPA: hypothetical protein VFI11_04965, partial [Anaerolineales bacterium]|nr:hypothetical protein [Anaerolineales bacterium]